MNQSVLIGPGLLVQCSCSEGDTSQSLRGVRNLLGEVWEPRGEVREPRGEVREPEPRGEGESRCNFEGEVLVEEVPRFKPVTL